MENARKILGSFLCLDEKDDGLVSQLMFFIPFGLWILARFLLKESAVAGLFPDFITYTKVRIVCITCLAFREIVFGKWDRLTMLGLFALGWMAAMTFLAKYTVAFDSVIFIFAGRNVRLKRIALFMLVVLSAIFVVVVSLAATGVIADTVLMRGTTTRHQLGFAHPNKGPGLFFFIACCWIYLRGKRFGVIDALAILAIVAGLHYFTDARTSCAVTVLAALFALVVKKVPDSVFRKPPFAVLGVGSILICAVVSISLTVCYDPSVGWMNSLNKFLSGRLALGHTAIAKYGIPFLGQKVDSGLTVSYDVVAGVWQEAKRGTNTIIDCEYVRFLVACGWPFMLIALTLCTLVCARAWKQGEWVLLLLIAIIAIHGISENYGPYAFYDPFLFLIGGLFYRERKTEEIMSLPEEPVREGSNV